jgi:hypothetical protein
VMVIFSANQRESVVSINNGRKIRPYPRETPFGDLSP